jgi:3-oxoacyl-[acyl-carrier protein] reductase
MTTGLLAGRAAIVTGAASGIGRAIAGLLHAEGAHVAIADRDLAAADAVAAVLGDRAFAVRVDVSVSADVEALAQAVASRCGGIEILVNCAGVPQIAGPVEEVTEDLWQRVMDVNAKSVYLTARHVVPHMKRGGRGTIVTIASIVGVRPRPAQSAYCASKGAAIALSQSLALELAASGIRVNVVNPGAAETPMLGQFLPPGADLAAGKRTFAGNIPLGRLIQPDDVAQAVLYLASDLSANVTGAVLNVDGGRGV